MAWQLATDIENALWTAAQRVLPKPAYTGRALREAIIARSRRYTSEREQLAEPAGNRAARDADLAARALFFTPADAAKVAVPVGELDRRGLLPSTGQLSIIDAGAGAGAMTLGLLDYLRARRQPTDDLHVRVRAIDRDARALEVMRATLDELDRQPDFGIRVALTVESADIACLARADLRASADLVLAGTVLNEVPADVRPDIVRSMLAGLRPGGSAIIIEPALRATARDLHRLRDRLLADKLAHVFAPCTRTEAPCPALAEERDWCHEDRPSNLGPRTASLASATGLRVHGLKFAYLTLRHEPGTLAEAPSETRRQGESDARIALRVVSRPRRHKGVRECFACGPDGRVRIRLLKRNRGPDNAPFADARRGDVLLAPTNLASGGDVTRSHAIDCVALVPPSAGRGRRD